jgi:hypothetical protein
VNPKSRVRAFIAAQMNGTATTIEPEPVEAPEHTASAADELEQQLLDQFSDGEFEDYGQHADPMSQEEQAFVAQQTKIHDITEHEEISVTQDMMKDHAMESLTDSHAISTMVNIAEAMMTPQKQVTTDKSKYLQIKAERDKAKALQQQIKFK